MCRLRIFKTRAFRRWALDVGLTDAALLATVDEIERGQACVDLGGGVLKKRIGISGRGRSGGARILLVTNRRDRWFIVFGFLKSQRANIGRRELDALRALSRDLLTLNERQIDAQAKTGAFEEITR